MNQCASCTWSIRLKHPQISGDWLPKSLPGSGSIASGHKVEIISCSTVFDVACLGFMYLDFAAWSFFEFCLGLMAIDHVYIAGRSMWTKWSPKGKPRCEIGFRFSSGWDINQIYHWDDIKNRCAWSFRINLMRYCPTWRSCMWFKFNILTCYTANVL